MMIVLKFFTAIPGDDQPPGMRRSVGNIPISGQFHVDSEISIWYAHDALRQKVKHMAMRNFSLNPFCKEFKNRPL